MSDEVGFSPRKVIGKKKSADVGFSQKKVIGEKSDDDGFSQRKVVGKKALMMSDSAQKKAISKKSDDVVYPTVDSVAPGNLLGDAGDEDPRPGPRYGGQGVPRRPTAVSH